MVKQLLKHRNELGRDGESATSDYLIKKGYQIVKRNYRCRIGEIDIIASINEYLVFVEVKTRKESKLDVNPLISITKQKTKRIIEICNHYLSEFEITDKQPRFDAVGVTLHKNGVYSFEHIENAF